MQSSPNNSADPVGCGQQVALARGRDDGQVGVGVGGELDRPSSLGHSAHAVPSAAVSVAQLQRAVLCARRGGLCQLPLHPSGPRMPIGPLDVPGSLRVVAVVAAHAGAGATMVATALAESAAERDLGVDLIEAADPIRSGLASAADAELDSDPETGWRRGRRGSVTLHRRSGSPPLLTWPTLTTRSGPRLVVADLPTPAGPAPASWPAELVLVARATAPGVIAVERLLAGLVDRQVAVAVIGPRRWPRLVQASVGPRLSGLRAAGRVVRIRVDRTLAVTGVTGTAMPRSIVADAGRLLDLRDSGAGDALADQAPQVVGAGAAR